MDLLGDDGLLDLRKRGKTSDPSAFAEETRRHRTTLPESNRELETWAQNHARPERPGPQAANHCHACTRPPRLVCKSCERPTCAAHSWAMLGVCRDCATEERMKRWHGSTVSDRNWLEDP